MASPETSKERGPVAIGSTVVVPMALQAFVVATDFEDSQYQVAPIIQPDYSKLILKDGEIGHDLMDQLDMSYWRLQARFNPRFINLDTGFTRGERSGVYLSWCLPRMYRAGIMATESAIDTEEGRYAYNARRIRSGYSKMQDKKGDVHFRPAPDKWLVIRRSTSSGKNLAAWVVDSNSILTVEDEAFRNVDMELVTSPGLDVNSDIEDQHRIFMGRHASIFSGYPDLNNKHRFPFNAIETGHEFFADYQPHNMGVFSFFDNLNGVEEDNLSYIVMGFHSRAEDDPFSVQDAPPSINGSETNFTNSELVQAMSLVVDRQGTGAAEFLDRPAGTDGCTLAHGVLRNIPWSRHVTDLIVPSIELQDRLYRHQPVAVGMHTLDALSAFLKVRLGPTDSNDPVNILLGQLFMLIARPDDVASQRKAADEVALYGWVAYAQGTIWQLPKDDNDTSSSTKSLNDHVKALEELNALQRRLDTLYREKGQLLQGLYSCWWNATGLRKFPSHLHPKRREVIKKRSEQISARIQTLRSIMISTGDDIEVKKSGLEKLFRGKELSATATQAFGTHQDPTVLFAGAKSGWPEGFNDPQNVRMASEVAPGSQNTPMEGVSLPSWVKELAQALLAEFCESNTAQRTWKPNPYAGLEDINATQGWFPLFMEWEVEYYHIPFRHWVCERDKGTGQWQYAISPKQNLAQLLASEGVDCRTIGGRTAIAPEVATTLRTRLEQLLPEVEDEEESKKRQKVMKAVASLEYFTGNLGGFTEHLLTLRRGQLARPTATDGEIQEALGIDAESFQLMSKMAHEVAPYGATTPLPPHYAAFSPFKPVTHGQIRFTKMVLVDKFGQVVSAIEPGKYNTIGSALYPCVSSSMACNPLPGDTSDHYPNTAVKADTDANVCQFVQIPPRINQPARLNSRFLAPLEGAANETKRRSAGDMTNPIWGWLVVNYQGHSIQVYNGEGEFVVEALLEGSAVCFSQGPHQGHIPDPTGRLRILIDEMATHSFTNDLFDLLASASDNVALDGDGHHGMLPAAFGRPFCMADIGVSIELATAPHTNESLLTTSAVDPVQKPVLLDYKFPVVLGNYTASFDGLVGTFAANGAIGHIRSAYGKSPTEAIYEPLQVRPYFLPGDAPDLESAHNAHLSRTCVSAILDPTTPTHIYTGGLFPLAEIVPPRWRTDQVMRRMQAFFAVGPTLVPKMPQTGLAHTQSLESGSNQPEAGPVVQMTGKIDKRR